jgi:hypothetical protein
MADLDSLAQAMVEGGSRTEKMEYPSAARVNEAIDYGLGSGRFAGEVDMGLRRMAPKERRGLVGILRRRVPSGDLNEHVRYINRHWEVLRQASILIANSRLSAKEFPRRMGRM